MGLTQAQITQIQNDQTVLQTAISSAATTTTSGTTSTTTSSTGSGGTVFGRSDRHPNAADGSAERHGQRCRATHAAIGA